MAAILFAGDPHGNFRPIVDAAVRQKPRAVVLLGDYDLAMPLDQEMKPVVNAGIEIWWIRGNHDADREGWHDLLFSSALADFDLNGRVADIGGVRVAGLGGVFDPKVWHPGAGDGQPLHRSADALAEALSWRGEPVRGPVRNGIPLRHRSAIFWSDYEALWDLHADVLVCHEAPESHRHGFRQLGELAEAMGVQVVIHGHHHESYEGVTAGGVRVVGVDREAVFRLEGLGG